MTLAIEFGNVKFATELTKTKPTLRNTWKHISKDLNITVQFVGNNLNPERP